MAAILFFAVLAGIYALLYYLNHKTPLPEGCENIKAGCEGCHDASCGNHPSHDLSGKDE